MLTQWCLPPPSTSIVNLSLFMHAHSSPLSLAARLHQCHANCSIILTMAGLFPDRPQKKKRALANSFVHREPETALPRCCLQRVNTCQGPEVPVALEMRTVRSGVGDDCQEVTTCYVWRQAGNTSEEIMWYECIFLFKLQLQRSYQLLNLEFSPGVASWHSLQEGSLVPEATRTRVLLILCVDRH